MWNTSFLISSLVSLRPMRLSGSKKNNNNKNTTMITIKWKQVFNQRSYNHWDRLSIWTFLFIWSFKDRWTFYHDHLAYEQRAVFVATSNKCLYLFLKSGKKRVKTTSIFIEIAKVVDCSKSPIFSWDRLDIPRHTVTGILIFNCTEGAGVGNYSWGGGRGEGREK